MIITEACAAEKVRAFAAERGVPVVAVDGEFEGCLRLRDLMDAAEPLTETKQRGKKENRLVTDSGTHISRARMAIYPQTPLFWSWGHPPSQTPPSDSSNSTQSWLHLEFWSGAAPPRVGAIPNGALMPMKYL